jgi:hypothetical protein
MSLDTHLRPPLQSKPFPAVRKSTQSKLSNNRLRINAKTNSISPIRAYEANTNFMGSEMKFSTTTSALKIKKPSDLEIQESE